MARVCSDLALAGRLRHRVDGHARRRSSTSCPAGTGGWAAAGGRSRPPGACPTSGCGPQRVQVGLEDAADQVLGQRSAVEVVEQAAHRVDQRRARGSPGCRPGRARTPGRRAARASRRAAARSSAPARPCRAGPRRTRRAPPWPSTPTSRRRTAAPSMLLRGEPGQLEAGPVDDGLAELADLGVDAERHRASSWLGVLPCACRSGRRRTTRRRLDRSGLSTGSAASPRRCRRAFRKA